MLIDLILEGKVEGRIDQVEMRLELDRQFVSQIYMLECAMLKPHCLQPTPREETLCGS